MPPGFKIDWRKQFAKLEPFASEKGGVVHIRVGSESPTNAFLRTFNDYLVNSIWPKKWSTVNIDVDREQSHFLGDIVQRIGKKIGASVSVDDGRGVVVNIGNNNSAHQNLSIENVRVNVTGLTTLQARIETLCGLLKDVLEHRRIAIIFRNLESLSGNQLNLLHSCLWDDALAELISAGLLIIDVHAAGAASLSDSSWPPDPDIVLGLPSEYDYDDARAAKEDLINFALGMGLYADPMHASVFAETLLMSNQTVGGLHAALARSLTGLGRA
ncbi:hypothetical protein [Sinomonas atrocyanea]|uniref:hypothetical protein n=1 Tax=Sinomonas atrocyanea TaxID=37927 RepID=UPI00286741AD|nr:hypothetical protein [Sinomonas atrocyanea]MDR6620357.1 hypothetical protein [Sinomonas atrocyanea]